MAKNHTSPKTTHKVVYKRSYFRSCILGLTVSLSVLSITALTAVHWTQTRLLDTDAWALAMNRLLNNEEVTNSLGRYVTSQIFDDQAVEARVSEALPQRAAFIASPITGQLRELTEQASINVIKSEVFKNIWVSANTIAHQRIVDNARSGEPSSERAGQQTLATIDLSEIRQRIRSRLGVASEGVITAEQRNKAINIQANLQTTRENIRRYVTVTDFAYAILPALIAATILGSLAVARNRRRALMYISIGTVLFALLQLIGVKSLRPVIIDKVQEASYRPAVGEIYDSVVTSFNSSVYTVLLMALAVWAITLALGSNRLFTWVRKYFKTSKLRKTDYYEYWQEFRLVFAMYKAYIWAGFAIITLAALAFTVDISWQSIVNAVLVLIAFVSVVQIIGSPPYYIKARR